VLTPLMSDDFRGPFGWVLVHRSWLSTGFPVSSMFRRHLFLSPFLAIISTGLQFATQEAACMHP
jgi:hypothetical protein